MSLQSKCFPSLRLDPEPIRTIVVLQLSLRKHNMSKLQISPIYIHMPGPFPTM